MDTTSLVSSLFRSGALSTLRFRSKGIGLHHMAKDRWLGPSEHPFVCCGSLVGRLGASLVAFVAI